MHVDSEKEVFLDAKTLFKNGHIKMKKYLPFDKQNLIVELEAAF